MGLKHFSKKDKKKIMDAFKSKVAEANTAQQPTNKSKVCAASKGTGAVNTHSTTFPREMNPLARSNSQVPEAQHQNKVSKAPVIAGSMNNISAIKIDDIPGHHLIYPVAVMPADSCQSLTTLKTNLLKQKAPFHNSTGSIAVDISLSRQINQLSSSQSVLISNGKDVSELISQPQLTQKQFGLSHGHGPNVLDGSKIENKIEISETTSKEPQEKAQNIQTMGKTKSVFKQFKNAKGKLKAKKSQGRLHRNYQSQQNLETSNYDTLKGVAQGSSANLVKKSSQKNTKHNGKTVGKFSNLISGMARSKTTDAVPTIDTVFDAPNSNQTAIRPNQQNRPQMTKNPISHMNSAFSVNTASTNLSTIDLSVTGSKTTLAKSITAISNSNSEGQSPVTPKTMPFQSLTQLSQRNIIDKNMASIPKNKLPKSTSIAIHREDPIQAVDINYASLPFRNHNSNSKDGFPNDCQSRELIINEHEKYSPSSGQNIQTFDFHNSPEAAKMRSEAANCLNDSQLGQVLSTSGVFSEASFLGLSEDNRKIIRRTMSRDTILTNSTHRLLDDEEIASRLAVIQDNTIDEEQEFQKNQNLIMEDDRRSLTTVTPACSVLSTYDNDVDAETWHPKIHTDQGDHGHDRSRFLSSEVEGDRAGSNENTSSKNTSASKSIERTIGIKNLSSTKNIDYTNCKNTQEEEFTIDALSIRDDETSIEDEHLFTCTNGGFEPETEGTDLDTSQEMLLPAGIEMGTSMPRYSCLEALSESVSGSSTEKFEGNNGEQEDCESDAVSEIIMVKDSISEVDENRDESASQTSTIKPDRKILNYLNAEKDPETTSLHSFRSNQTKTYESEGFFQTVDESNDSNTDHLNSECAPVPLKRMTRSVCFIPKESELAALNAQKKRNPTKSDKHLNLNTTMQQATGSLPPLAKPRKSVSTMCLSKDNHKLNSSAPKDNQKNKSSALSDLDIAKARELKLIDIIFEQKLQIKKLVIENERLQLRLADMEEAGGQEGKNYKSKKQGKYKSGGNLC